jgi:hypothetical protein
MSLQPIQEPNKKKAKQINMVSRKDVVGNNNKVRHSPEK